MRAATATLLCFALAACTDELGPTKNAGVCVPLPPGLLDAGIDFGEVEDTGASFAFTLFSSSRATEVSFSPVAEPFFIAPVDATVGPTGTPILARFVPTDGRLQLATTEFVGGTGCAPQTLTLRGLGAGHLKTQPVLQLDDVPAFETSSHPLVVSNSRRTPLTIEPSGLFAPLSVDTSPVEVPANGFVTLDVQVAGFGPGTFTGNLVIRSHDATGRTRDVLTVLVVANIRERGLVPTPHSIRIEHLPSSPPIGAALQRTVVLNPAIDGGQLPATRFSLQPLDGQLSAASMVTPAGQHQVVLTFTPDQRPGERAWLLVLPSAFGMLTETVPITALVEPIATCAQPVTISPNGVNAPNLAFPAQLRFTLTNPNAGTCLVDGLRLEPPRWSRDGGEQLFLDGGASVDVVIDVGGPGTSNLGFVTYGAGSTTVPISLGH